MPKQDEIDEDGKGRELWLKTAKESFRRKAQKITG